LQEFFDYSLPLAGNIIYLNLLVSAGPGSINITVGGGIPSRKYCKEEEDIIFAI
jgi:hypothetical protein